MTNWSDSGRNDLDRFDLSELVPVDLNKTFKWYSVGDRRFREYYLTPDEDLFLIGTAAPHPDRSGDTIIRKGENNPTFLIGDQSEAVILNKLKWNTVLLTIGSFVAVIIGLILLMNELGQL